MVSTASAGAAVRIVARTLFKVLRAGLGTLVKYSSTVAAVIIREPPAFRLVFAIEQPLVARSYHASSVRFDAPQSGKPIRCTSEENRESERRVSQRGSLFSHGSHADRSA